MSSLGLYSRIRKPVLLSREIVSPAYMAPSLRTASCSSCFMFLMYIFSEDLASVRAPVKETVRGLSEVPMLALSSPSTLTFSSPPTRSRFLPVILV